MIVVVSIYDNILQCAIERKEYNNCVENELRLSIISTTTSNTRAIIITISLSFSFEILQRVVIAFVHFKMHAYFGMHESVTHVM